MAAGRGSTQMARDVSDIRASLLDGRDAQLRTRFHLLKRGVTNDSALNLIRRSFTPQAFRDALQATFKDRKVVLVAHAEM